MYQLTKSSHFLSFDSLMFGAYCVVFLLLPCYFCQRFMTRDLFVLPTFDDRGFFRRILDRTLYALLYDLYNVAFYGALSSKVCRLK